LRIRNVDHGPNPIFPILDPRPRVAKIPNPVPHQRIQVFLTQKTVSKPWEKLFGMFIPDPDFFPIPDPDPGSRSQKSTGSRIRIRNTA
jgi:hypothetical protein